VTPAAWWPGHVPAFRQRPHVPSAAVVRACNSGTGTMPQRAWTSATRSTRPADASTRHLLRDNDRTHRAISLPSCSDASPRLNSTTARWRHATAHRKPAPTTWWGASSNTYPARNRPSRAMISHPACPTHTAALLLAVHSARSQVTSSTGHSASCRCHSCPTLATACNHKDVHRPATNTVKEWGGMGGGVVKMCSSTVLGRRTHTETPALFGQGCRLAP